jgi:FkbM family methyltransferase
LRQVLVDCGANLGVVLRRFIAEFPDRDFYAFEPNAELHASIRKQVADSGHPRVSVSNRAVWTHNGTVELFLGHHESSTLLPGKSVPPVYDQQIDYKHPITVPCLDFSAWLKQMFIPEDEIIVKMDIEGAEYPVLRKMIADDTLGLVSVLHIEWHHDRFSWMTRAEHDELYTAVCAQVEVLEWN